MKVNVDRGGIISQAMQHVNAYGEPFKKGGNGHFEFIRYISSMARMNETRDMSRYLSLEQSIIGRIATAETELPDARYTLTQLALLNESVGIMPDYPGKSGVKKIGSVSISTSVAHDNHEWGLSILSSGIYNTDILTSGEVIASRLEIGICNVCSDVDIQKETQLLRKFGVGALKLTPVRGALINSWKHEKNVPLDDQQIDALKEYLGEVFPIDEGRVFDDQ